MKNASFRRYANTLKHGIIVQQVRKTEKKDTLSPILKMVKNTVDIKV